MTAQDIAATIDEDDAGPRPQARRALGVALIVALLAVVLDQGSKALAVAQLTPGERVPLVGDLFGLSLVYNPGAAFSLGSGSTWIFTLVGLLAAGAAVERVDACGQLRRTEGLGHIVVRACHQAGDLVHFLTSCG